MVSWRKVIGFLILAGVVLAIAVGGAAVISQRFGYDFLAIVPILLTAEIVLVGLARLIVGPPSGGGSSGADEEWQEEVRRKANRIVHQWDTNTVDHYEGRETIQEEFAAACGDLDDLLSEHPPNVDGETSRLIREVVAACNGFEDLQTRTKVGPVNMNDPDPDVPLVGASEDEIKRNFVNEGTAIVEKAERLRNHLTSSGFLGLF